MYTIFNKATVTEDIKHNSKEHMKAVTNTISEMSEQNNKQLAIQQIQIKSVNYYRKVD